MVFRINLKIILGSKAENIKHIEAQKNFNILRKKSVC